MGLKLISKFISVVKQVFPALHVVGFTACQTWRCSKKIKLGHELEGEVSEIDKDRSWKPQMLNFLNRTG